MTYDIKNKKVDTQYQHLIKNMALITYFNTITHLCQKYAHFLVISRISSDDYTLIHIIMIAVALLNYF